MSKIFTEWLVMEANKPYKIRLNPQDAEYGLNKNPEGYTQTSLDAWKAAWENTMREITLTLPKGVQEAITTLRTKEKNGFPKLVNLREDAACTRCGGSGKRNDRESWIHHGSLEKVCYKCGGSGIETSMEPVYFRRRAVDYVTKFIREKNYPKLDEWADKVINASEEEQPYRPVLIDVAKLLKDRKYQEVSRLPH